MADTLETDVLIIGAGPAGLAMAIRLKQQQKDLSVYVLEKGQAAGNHSLSGAVMDISALDELLPSWQEQFSGYEAVTKTRFCYLTKTSAYPLPHLPNANHYGCVIVSLSKLVRYLAEVAQSLGVEILNGYTGKTLIEESGVITGIRTGEFGLDKANQPTSQYQEGIDIFAKHIAIAEGAYGYLAEQVIKRFSLRKTPMTYGLGVKEVWRVQPNLHEPGLVIHTMGWPIPSDAYGGGFIYHGPEGKVSLGVIVGLDAPNPTLNPFKTLQQFKHHPILVNTLRGGEPIAYGARVINEGGYQSIPTLDFPGGVLIGCSAGFVNIVRIKGIHAAIYSGMEAANAWVNNMRFDQHFRKHQVVKDLYRARNVRPAFRFGLLPGLVVTGIDQYVFRGNMPFTFKHHPDHQSLSKDLAPIQYPKPDMKISFDLLTLLQLSNTKHREGQPSHLVLDKPELAINCNAKDYYSPETHYCPANVYEVVADSFVINHTNCLHCKACAIRDPNLNIKWLLPEGGGGPNYSET